MLIGIWPNAAGCCPLACVIAARVLATYLIPGALGEGSGWDLRIRPQAAASGNLGTWKSGIWGIWRSGDLEIQKFGVQEMIKIQFSKSKFILPEMWARSG